MLEEEEGREGRGGKRGEGRGGEGRGGKRGEGRGGRGGEGSGGGIRELSLAVVVGSVYVPV